MAEPYLDIYGQKFYEGKVYPGVIGEDFLSGFMFDSNRIVEHSLNDDKDEASLVVSDGNFKVEQTVRITGELAKVIIFNFYKTYDN